MKHSDHIENNEHEFLLAKWMAGEISDNKMIEIIGEKEFRVYHKILKGVEVDAKLNMPRDDSYDQIMQKISERKKPKVFRLRNFGVAASIIAVAFVAVQFFFSNGFLSNHLISYQSDFGTQEQINLLDNSRVVLNSNSQLTYNKSDWKQNRSLELNGEAYFKVSKGSTFTVNTANGVVQVLGTEFKVVSDKDYFSVVCYEGMVSVKTAATEHLLTKNKAVRNNNGSVNLFETNQNKPAWLHGESSFVSAPLVQVLRAIENQFNVDINDKNLDSSQVFTGFFPHNDLDVALQTVLTSFNISYKKTDSGSISLTYNE